MTSIYKTYDTVADIEGTAGSPTSLSGTTEEFSASIDLNEKAGVSVTVDIDFDASPTDNVDIKWYGSDDGTNWDDVALGAVRVKAVSDAWKQITIVLGPSSSRYVRFGFVQTGATDSHNIHATKMTWYWTSV